MKARLLALALIAAPFAPLPAAAAEPACQPAGTFSGIRPPARFGNEEVAVAPWEGGLLFWSRDARYQFSAEAGIEILYRDGRRCRVSLADAQLSVVRLPVAAGQAASIAASLCPVQAPAEPCLRSTLEFLPR